MIGRAGVPGLMGLLVLVIAAEAILSALSPGNEDGLVYRLRSAVVPVVIGVALLLVAIAIATRSRSGLVLGGGTAVLLALAGIGFIVLQIPYLEQGGMSAAFAGPFIGIAAIWTLAWAVWGLRTWRWRAAFSSEWRPADRRIAIALGLLVLLGGGAWLGLGSLERQASVDFDAAYAEAQAHIAGTTAEVLLVEFTLAETTGAEPPPAVERLVLELTVHSAASYPLMDVPRLCLVDRATAESDAYKQDTVCWGTAGSPLLLEADFGDRTVDAGATTVQLEVDRGASPCAFPSGPWIAQLTLAPDTMTVETDALSPWPQSFTIEATFDVPADATGARPSQDVTGSPGAAGSGGDCFGISR